MVLVEELVEHSHFVGVHYPLDVDLFVVMKVPAFEELKNAHEAFDYLLGKLLLSVAFVEPTY